MPGRKAKVEVSIFKIWEMFYHVTNSLIKYLTVRIQYYWIPRNIFLAVIFWASAKQTLVSHRVLAQLPLLISQHIKFKMDILTWSFLRHFIRWNFKTYYFWKKCHNREWNFNLNVNPCCPFTYFQKFS